MKAALIISCLIFLLIVLSRLNKPGEEITGNEVTEIFVMDNGVHTSIALPLNTHMVSWDSVLNLSEIKGDSVSFKYIGFSWGDKAFYINTPTWGDLKLSIAIKALFIPTPSVIKVNGLPALYESDNIVAVPVSNDKYLQLYHYINSSFDKDINGKPVKEAPGHSRNSAFYKAREKYHLFKNSNTWAAGGLRKAGVKTPLIPLISGRIIVVLKKRYRENEMNYPGF